MWCTDDMRPSVRGEAVAAAVACDCEVRFLIFSVTHFDLPRLVLVYCDSFLEHKGGALYAHGDGTHCSPGVKYFFSSATVRSRV